MNKLGFYVITLLDEKKYPKTEPSGILSSIKLIGKRRGASRVV